MKAWGGRFSEAPDALAADFGRSIEVDAELALDDIAGSIAHVHGLERAGLLRADEVAALVEGLRLHPRDPVKGVLEGAGHRRVVLRRGDDERIARLQSPAKLLRGGGNVILLDEPTNDLDVETLRVLEEAIQSFAGCLVVVTHDRYFLDRVATHILALDGEGGARWFEGNYQAWAERVREERVARGENPDLPRGPVRRIPGK